MKHLLWFALGWGSAAFAAEFTVAPSGQDDGPGSAQQPFATVARAQQAVRELRAAQPRRATPVTVDIQPGFYPLAETLVFGPEDSGTDASPTIWRAAPGGEVVISGGRKLTDWTVADGRWTLQLPADQPLFSQLYVNSEPRYRPRLPKSGYYTIAATLEPTEANKERGSDRFGFKEGQLRSDWHNLGDVEVITSTYWSAPRLRVAAVDEAQRIVTFTGPTAATADWYSLSAGKNFVIDNVREALTEPGQWYLDSQSRVLTYLPLPGETPANTTVIAPALEELVRWAGQPEADRLIRRQRYEGLTFAHSNSICPPQGKLGTQGETMLGALGLGMGLQDSEFVNCTFAHTGAYALHLTAGCQRNLLERCVFTDLGAGGLRLGGGVVPTDPRDECGWHTVRDCTFSHGGRIHPAGQAVWIGQSVYNTIEHNDIYDFYNIGVSVGWTWGYGPSFGDHNRIADNRIWQIGQGWLSDMGAIYTIGGHAGTVIEHNLCHDINAATYGGWGIYFDEGTADIVARNNLIYNTKTGGFHQHYGKNNLFENNIVAFASVGQLQRTRPEEHHQFTIQRNLIYYDQGQAAHGNFANPDQYTIDYNLYWDASGEPVEPAGRTWAEWQAGGTDVHSIIADPLFVNPKQGDFRLRPGSPASTIGFVPFPLSGWGSRDPSQAWALKEVPPAWPNGAARLVPQAVSLDFEGQEVGTEPAELTGHLDTTVSAATARISDESPASGNRCLKLADAPGQYAGWLPMVTLHPMFNRGPVTVSFDVKLGPGAEFLVEWRDERQQPYLVGPTLSSNADRLLSCGERQLVTLPTGHWMHFEMTGSTGYHETANWTLELTLPDGQVRRWTDLPSSPRFRQLSWLGWASMATTATEIWIDNITVGPAQ